MADNPTVNGIPVATDEIAGKHHQRIKVQFGVDGSATDVSSTNALPVDPGQVDATIVSSVITTPILDYALVVNPAGAVVEVDVLRKSFLLTSDGDIVAAAGANNEIWVIALKMMSTAAQATCQIRNGAAGSVLDHAFPGINGGYVAAPTSFIWYKTTANTALYLNSFDTAGSVGGSVIYAVVSTV